LNIVLAIGLMSGAAGEGIEAALIETDSYEHIRPLAFKTYPYSDAVRDLIERAKTAASRHSIIEADPVIDEAAMIVTSLHLEAVRKFVESTGFERSEIEAIGFHGHTIAHRPAQNLTWQIGSGDNLATESRIPVVSDFGRTDAEAGGFGAPLLPVFHRGIFHEEPKPVAILDIGHTSKLTAFYSDGEICALDCGLGTALIDAWMVRHGAGGFDDGGTLAAKGRVDEHVIDRLVANPWFRLPTPKSFNPNDVGLDVVAGLSFEDGLATLTAYAAESVTRAILQIAQRPDRFWVSGGGRKNETLIRMIRARSGISTEIIDRLGWQGDAMDAQAMAYLAIRRMAFKSSTFPETTGVSQPLSCGVIYQPMDRRSMTRD
jgi:anhydro-N-acetylmuramic acid kinase